MDKSNFLINAIKKNGTVYASLSTIGGFIGDVLQPLAPFSEYIFYISAVISLLLLLTYFIIGGIRERIASLLILSITILIVTGGIFGLQSVTKSDNGVLSEAVPGIKSLQSSLQIVEKGIVDIKSDTTEIKKSTNEISAKIDILGEKVGKQGGIILNPNTPEEYYSNAKHYELKGDFLNARKSYLKYFTFKKDFIDPHLKFFKLLKIQEGRSGARETYADLKSMYPSIAVEVVYALSLQDTKKIKQLEKLAISHPHYSPIMYFLSREYSLDNLGEQTLDEKKLEKKYLEKFIGMVDDGAYLKYYLDKNVATEQYEEALSRYKSTEALFKNHVENPVSLSIMVHNSGISVNVQVSEQATEISYSYKKDGIYKTTGEGYVMNGKKWPKTFFDISYPDVNQKIIPMFIKYKDIKGQEHGPFDLSFDPWDKYRASSKEILSSINSGWVNIRKDPNYPNIYFSLISYRAGIKKILYGINKNIPDTEFPIETCTVFGECNRYPGGTTPYIEYNDSFKYISVQVIFYDNEKSDVFIYKK